MRAGFPNTLQFISNGPMVSDWLVELHSVYPRMLPVILNTENNFTKVKLKKKLKMEKPTAVWSSQGGIQRLVATAFLNLMLELFTVWNCEKDKKLLSIGYRKNNLLLRSLQSCCRLLLSCNWNCSDHVLLHVFLARLPLLQVKDVSVLF